MAEVNPKLLDVWVSDTIWLDVYAEADATPPPGNNITNKVIDYQRMRK